MTGPGAALLLQAWEDGLDATPTTRALSLLAAAAPGTAAADLADLAIGTRDLGLLRLRAVLFGDRVEAVCRCRACEETLDISFDLRDLLGSKLHDVELLELGETAHREITLGRYRIAVRAATSADLLAVAAEQDVDRARTALLNRCVVAVVGPNGPCAADGVPDSLLDQLDAAVAALDPYAAIEFDVDCVGCGRQWRTSFDAADFLWSEIHAWAQRTLRDVHTLALAYGWHEADILAMSARRRRTYIELVS